MKKKIAIALSIFFFGLASIGMCILADSLGISVYTDYGETVTITHRYYEEESDGRITEVGWFIMFFNAMLAWRMYRWVVSGKFDGDISIESHTKWLFWLAGMSAFLLVNALILQIEMNGHFQRIIQTGCSVGIAWFAVCRHSEAIEKIQNSKDNHT